MSYSRWGKDSRWYTYWQYRDDETRDNSIFSICTIVNYTAKQLRANMKKCISGVVKLAPEATQGEVEELRVYMEQFLDDVDIAYPQGA